MDKTGIRLLSLLAVLAMLLLPGVPGVSAAPFACVDIGGEITYAGQTEDIFDDPSKQYGVPVGTPLTFTITRKNPALAGKEIKFASPNQFLQLDESSISDNGANVVVKYNNQISLPNVNFEVIWKAGDTTGDAKVSFVATIHPSNVPAGHERGALLTLTAKVQGGRCSAEFQIFGLPGGGGPGPIPLMPCPGIVVDIAYSADGGATFTHVATISAPSGTQYSGPAVGDIIEYVIKPTVFPVDFTETLRHTASFNRQRVDSASGAPFTISLDKKKVTFQWDGEELTVLTTALTQGLDTIKFESTNPSRNNSVVTVCSTKAELVIAAS